MKTFQVNSDRYPSGSEAVKLLEAVGWGKASDYDADKWDKSFSVGLTITAYDDDRLVGLLRGFTDTVSETHIMYVVVAPDYQRRGVGRSLVDKVRREYSGTALYTTSFSDTEEFFSKCGLRKQSKLIPFSLPPL